MKAMLTSLSLLAFLTSMPLLANTVVAGAQVPPR